MQYARAQVHRPCCCLGQDVRPLPPLPHTLRGVCRVCCCSVGALARGQRARHASRKSMRGGPLTSPHARASPLAGRPAEVFHLPHPGHIRSSPFQISNTGQLSKTSKADHGRGWVGHIASLDADSRCAASARCAMMGATRARGKGGSTGSEGTDDGRSRAPARPSGTANLWGSCLRLSRRLPLLGRE